MQEGASQQWECKGGCGMEGRSNFCSFPPPWVRVLLVLVAAVVTAWAQFTSGIEGSVMDPTGAVVPGAKVTLRNTDTGETRTLDTTGAGYYRFPALPAANFELTVVSSGFKTAVQRGIRTQVADTKTVNFTLEVGAAESRVEVTAQAPLVEASEGRISGFVEQQKVEELPLVGRNTFNLVLLTPGVTGIPAGGGQSYAQAGGDTFGAEQSPGMNANWQPRPGNYFAVDAASTNNAAHGGVTSLSPNPEAVQEIRISTNNFSAEYGRNSSIMVNVMTKQGTNAFHGGASWFFTNDALQAEPLSRVRFPISHATNTPALRRSDFAKTTLSSSGRSACAVQHRRRPHDDLADAGLHPMDAADQSEQRLHGRADTLPNHRHAGPQFQDRRHAAGLQLHRFKLSHHLGGHDSMQPAGDGRDQFLILQSTRRQAVQLPYRPQPERL